MALAGGYGLGAGDVMRLRDIFGACSIVACSLLLNMAAAQAERIRYTEFAVVSGSLNGQSFSNQLLTITGIGEIQKPGTEPGAWVSRISSPNLLTFTLSGGAAGTFTDPALFAFSNSNGGVDPFAGFTDITQHAPILVVINSSAFLSYFMTPIGPTTGTSAFGHAFFPTTAGLLNLTSADVGTFGAELLPTPLPPSAVMMLPVLAGLYFARRRARRIRQT